MNIELHTEQFEELILLAALGAYIKGAVEDLEGTYAGESKVLRYLLGRGQENGMSNLVEEFHGAFIPSDALSNKVDEIMEIYNEDEFWYSLATDLGRRDFFRDLSQEELAAIRKDPEGWFPEKIHDYYDKYEREFEKYGTGRLEIKG